MTESGLKTLTEIHKFLHINQQTYIDLEETFWNNIYIQRVRSNMVFKISAQTKTIVIIDD